MVQETLKKNVLIISIDSLRPEAVGCYPTRFSFVETFPYIVSTPSIDALAKEGVLFTTLICQAPFTPASHASFFTGLNPPSHGIQAFFGCKLHPQAETLAARLRKEGYRTAAFIGADALNSRFGLDRGFDVYDAKFDSKMDSWIQGEYRRLGREATQRALDWSQDSREPFFLFVHYFDAHLIAHHILARNDPIARVLLQKAYGMRDHASLFSRFFQALDRFYGKYQRYGKPFHVRHVRRIDREVARLVRNLKERDLYDQTVIVVMSDHGDAFGEHGEIGHRKRLYDTTVRVPLILKGPAEHKGKMLTTLVRSIDLVPTVYELLGLEPQASTGYKPIEGKSLLRVIEDREAEERMAYSETRMEKSRKNTEDLKSHYVAMRTSRWKLIINILNGNREFYDVVRDPGEARNVIATEHTDMSEHLFQAAMNIFGTDGEKDKHHVTYSDKEREEIERRLRDLGYL